MSLQRKGESLNMGRVSGLYGNSAFTTGFTNGILCGPANSSVCDLPELEG